MSESFLGRHPYSTQGFRRSRVADAVWGVAVSLEREWTRLRRGDVEAVAALMERYQHRLYRYLLRLVRQPATAEDLFQQTWLRVMERIQSYNPQRSFEGWLFALAHNLAIDFLRRYRPESLDDPLPSRDSRVETLAGCGSGALEQLLARERAGRLAESVVEFPVVFREVLTLRFEEYMHLHELPPVLGPP